VLNGRSDGAVSQYNDSKNKVRLQQKQAEKYMVVIEGVAK